MNTFKLIGWLALMMTAIFFGLATKLVRDSFTNTFSMRGIGRFM